MTDICKYQIPVLKEQSSFSLPDKFQYGQDYEKIFYVVSVHKKEYRKKQKR